MRSFKADPSVRIVGQKIASSALSVVKKGSCKVLNKVCERDSTIFCQKKVDERGTFSVKMVP